MPSFPILSRQLSAVLAAAAMLAAVVLLGPAARTGLSDQALAYVEPALRDGDFTQLDVIVSGRSAAQAAAAVTAVGGQVTAELWLVDAVAAVVPADQLTALARTTGIRSVVANQQIAVASGPGNGNGNGNGFGQGYVTGRRVEKGKHLLDGTQSVPTVDLPDGGHVSLSSNGSVLFLNEDGSERVRVTLSNGPYVTAPIVGPDGSVYIAGEGKKVYALAPDGTTLWTVNPTGIGNLKGGLSLDGAGQLYVPEEDGVLLALSAATGAELWRFTALTGGDKLLSAPVIGPDSRIYMVSEKGRLFSLNSDGSLAWEFAPGVGDPFLMPPQFGADGTIYYAGDDKHFFAVSPSGAQLYQFVTGSRIKAQPAIASDGRVFVAAEDRTLYALNPDGTLAFEFRPPSGHFRTTPVLSADETAVFVAIEERVFYAVDATTGNELWQFPTLGDIKGDPVLDTDGNIVVVSDGMDMTILTPNGGIVHGATFAGALTQTPTTRDTGEIIVRVGTSNVSVLAMLPDEWDGTPDVQPTDSKKVWKLVNPVTIDVGADIVHNTLDEFGAPITGDEITVAVIDTGIYFTDEVKQEVGNKIKKLFQGQVDFAGDGTCPPGDPTLYIQYADYCYTEEDGSYDGFGHGSHVAGIIWNNFTDERTGVYMGVAPDAHILSVRVMDDMGLGSYADVIEGVQYVVANKDVLNIRIMNLSLSAPATTPYFVDPLNRAVEEAWAAGIVVVAAAGNTGPEAQTVTVPGNDPYVITVGAVDTRRTPGYWLDNMLADFSATGPTMDGFIKPDVLAPGANIVSYMYNDHNDINNSSYLVQIHPDYSESTSLFRMNGTSMATPIVSGVVAMLLQVEPNLTPDEVKFRLMYSARPAFIDDGDLAYSPLQQGAGMVWAPHAILGDFFVDENGNHGVANAGMNIDDDLAHGWMLLDANGNPVLDANGDPVVDPAELAYHYQGPVQRVTSDDGLYYLYYVEDTANNALNVLGGARVSDMQWVDLATLEAAGVTFLDTSDGPTPWNDGSDPWASGFYNWSGGFYNWSGGFYNWSGGFYNWSGGFYNWSGGFYNWSGGFYNWSGGFYNWSGNSEWAAGVANQAFSSSTTEWVGDPGQPISQTISLTPGWIQISAYVAPLQADVATLLADIADDMVLMKNGAGDVYWPAYDIDDIGVWQMGEGYRIYVNAPVTLSLYGYDLSGRDLPLPLAAGWNEIAYTRGTPQPVATAMSDLGGNLLMVKDGEGNVYWPAFGVDTIGDLQPGAGYQVYMNESDVLQFGPGGASLAAPASPAPEHFTSCATGTGNNATMLLPYNIKLTHSEGAFYPAVGDEVAVYRPDGVTCAGVVKWDAAFGTLLLTIWGDDDQTAVVEGLQAGEWFEVRAWDQSTGDEYVIDFSFRNDTPFDDSGLYDANRFYGGETLAPTAVTFSHAGPAPADHASANLLFLTAIILCGLSLAASRRRLVFAPQR